MHNSWLKMQRAARGLLAAALIASSVLAPLAVAPQTAQAQTSAPAAGTIAVVIADEATLYATPQGDEIGSLRRGEMLTPMARTADAEWLAVRTADDIEGWMQVDDIVVSGITSLPVAGASDDQPPTAATVAATAAAVATQAPAVPPTPTPTPTPSPTPAATATVAVTATATTPAIPMGSAGQPVRSLMAVAGRAGADLYDIPGGAKVQHLPVASRVTAALRNAAGDWVFVTTNDGASGWTPAANLVAFGLDRLPVLDVSAGDGAAAETSESAAATPDDAAATDAAATDAADTAAADTADTADTAESAAMAAPAAGVPATVTITEQRLNIRSGPGAEYRIIEKAQPGAVLTATARTADSAWVRIWRDDLPDGGWVSAQFVAVDDLAALPVDESVAADEAEAEAEADAPAEQATQPAAAATPAAMPTATPAPAADATQTEAAAPAGETAAATTATVATATVATLAAPAQSVPAAQPAGLEGTLVFQDGRNNIYVYELATGNVRWLTNGYDPDITLDGQRVTFVRGGGDVNGVWTINIDGSNERQVHGGGEIMRSPKWSPDGEWIVFSRNNTNWHCFNTEFLGCVSIYELMGRITLGPIQLPPPGPGVPTKDDIKRSIIDRILNGAERLELPNWIITRINADGGDFRDINALDSAVSPDWNAAGIVYQAKPGLEITQDTPDGRTKALIQEGWDWDPDWEPNGGRIVYQSKEGSHWEIFSISPDGGAPFALTRPETTLVDQMPSNVAPAFSPDGQHIVYLSNRDEDEEAGPWRLWVMDNGGGNKRPLPIDITLDYGFGSDQAVSWGR